MFGWHVGWRAPLLGLTLSSKKKNKNRYVAKDKDTGFRETFVFDTGVFSDDVMSTMGQAFVLAQELAKKGSSAHQGDDTYAAVDEALRMAPGAEQFYADAAAGK